MTIKGFSKEFLELTGFKFQLDLASDIKRSKKSLCYSSPDLYNYPRALYIIGFAVVGMVIEKRPSDDQELSFILVDDFVGDFLFIYFFWNKQKKIFFRFERKPLDPKSVEIEKNKQDVKEVLDWIKEIETALGPQSYGLYFRGNSDFAHFILKSEKLSLTEHGRIDLENLKLRVLNPEAEK